MTDTFTPSTSVNGRAYQDALDVIAKHSAEEAEIVRRLRLKEINGETEEPRRKKTSWTLAEIYATKFPEPNWVVPGVVQEGLVLLAGRPKFGKSRLLLQLSGAVASGGKFLGRDVKRGEVLFLALEDNPRRIQERATAMRIPASVAQNIHFEFSWEPLQAGGLDSLEAALNEHPYRVVIIDTLARATPGVDHKDENPIGPIMDRLQNLAISKGITILPADHTRKSSGVYPDAIDDVMGSTSKSRALDAVLAIYKEQGKAGAVLRGRGRETPELDEALAYDIVTGTWQSNGDASEFKLTVRRREIIEAVRELGKAPQKTIMEFMEEPYEKNKGNFHRELSNLVASGHLGSESLGGKVVYYVIE